MKKINILNYTGTVTGIRDYFVDLQGTSGPITLPIADLADTDKAALTIGAILNYKVEYHVKSRKQKARVSTLTLQESKEPPYEEHALEELYELARNETDRGL